MAQNLMSSFNYHRVAAADEDVIDRTIRSANAVFESGIWSRSDVRHRAQVLNAIAQALRSDLGRLAEMEVAQTGRPIRYVGGRSLVQLLAPNN